MSANLEVDFFHIYTLLLYCPSCPWSPVNKNSISKRRSLAKASSNNLLAVTQELICSSESVMVTPMSNLQILPLSMTSNTVLTANMTETIQVWRSRCNTLNINPFNFRRKF
ncbi:hypothetical protein T4D_2248 [Trichinella pseudospiralis]|uniref:Uncharacterized protein n=1 Tax=Trichinella pseudospiralis TaxID=6337 RepID=A0A0V1F7L8_TRIPS|nr:hypothetical protein T4D_2248 [Trichinella pseudospiralis]